MCVDAERGLVENEVTVRVVVAVVHFRFGGDGEVLVGFAEELSASGREEAGVREDYGDTNVKEIECLEVFGGIVD
jgi:hypothetical protein